MNLVCMAGQVNDYPLFSRAMEGFPAKPGSPGPLRRSMVRKPPANTPGWNAAGLPPPLCCRPPLYSMAQHNALAPAPSHPAPWRKHLSHTSTTCTSRHPHAKMSIVCGAQRAPCGLDSRKTKLGTSHPSLKYLCKEWPPCECFSRILMDMFQVFKL